MINCQFLRLKIRWKTTFIPLLVGSFFTAFSVSAQASNNAPDDKNSKRVWITIGSDALKVIEKEKLDALQIQSPKNPKQSSIENDIRVFSIPENKITALNQLMHEELNRCGGFFFHESLDIAQKSVSNFKPASQAKQQAYSITNGQTVTALLAQMNPQNMTATVDGLSNFYSRYYARQSGVDASDWLMQQWQSITAGRTDMTVTQVSHSWAQPSVMVTIEGTTNPEQIVVIGGHLDSINGSNPSNGLAPGSDDNASGIAVITETLSAIVASDYRPARTIKIIGYAAEEVGLRGSQDIAQQHSADNLQVVGVTQFDMTGFNGSQNDIVFISDYTDADQTEFLADLLDTYFPSTQYGFSQCGYACSDHASWTAQGFPASFPFEANFNQSNSRIHTSTDNTFNLIHATHFLQLSIAFVAELAKGGIGETQLASIQFDLIQQEVTSGETVTVEVQRVGSDTDALTIDYATVNQSAVAGTDFTAASGTLNWSAQETSTKTIQVSTNAITSDKTFIIALSNPQGGLMGPNDQIEITMKASAVVEPPPSTSSGGGAMLYGVLLLLMIRTMKSFVGSSKIKNS